MQRISIPPSLRQYWAYAVGTGACLLCFVAGITYGRAHPLAQPSSEPPPVVSQMSTAEPVQAKTPSAPVEPLVPETVANIPAAAVSKPGPEPAVTAQPEQAQLAIQITSLRDPTLADQHRRNLQQQGLPAFVEPVAISGSDERYRVLVGPYADRAKAVADLQVISRDPRFSGSFIRPY